MLGGGETNSKAKANEGGFFCPPRASLWKALDCVRFFNKPFPTRRCLASAAEEAEKPLTLLVALEDDKKAAATDGRMSDAARCERCLL